ncbi:hypothetical protein [Algoriphagus sp.]|uniref:hypothetical protein n=1 Tax=Algoriphagus sp. TaxID=1872435 RepID=UPI00391C7E78
MEKELNSKESLALITSMIQEAKKEAAGDGSFQLLLWGWVVALCNLGHFILAKVGFDRPYFIWLLIIPAIIWSFAHEWNNRKKARIKTHLDQFLGQLWIGVFVAICIVLSFMSVLDFRHNPIILLLAAIGVYATGSIVSVKILRAGGMILAIGAIIAFLLPVNDQYLAAGISMILGYLVPGYYLKNQKL